MILTFAAVEVRLDLRHVAELRRADRREVLRMREHHRPGVADPVVEADPPLRGVGLEVGRDVTEVQCHSSLVALRLELRSSNGRSAYIYYFKKYSVITLGCVDERVTRSTARGPSPTLRRLVPRERHGAERGRRDERRVVREHATAIARLRLDPVRRGARRSRRP